MSRSNHSQELIFKVINIKSLSRASIRTIFCHYRQLILAILVYILAHIFDYIITLQGLTNTSGEEANPFAQKYMDFFGLHKGLLIFKLQMIIIVMIAAFGIEHLYRNKGSKIRSEYILTIGAIFTFLGGSLWFLLLF
ncbi:MAG: DUF5658 family protein [Candidatus Poribacteria bacterium]